MVGAAGAVDLGALCRGPRAQGMVQDPRFATNRQRHAEPRGAGSRDRSGADDEHDRSLGRGAGSGRVPCGPVYDYAQMFTDPQVRHRGLVQHASDPELGEVPHIRTPVKIGDGMRVRTVAPKLGQHNEEIFGRLGVTEAEIKTLQAQRIL